MLPLLYPTTFSSDRRLLDFITPSTSLFSREPQALSYRATAAGQTPAATSLESGTYRHTAP